MNIINPATEEIITTIQEDNEVSLALKFEKLKNSNNNSSEKIKYNTNNKQMINEQNNDNKQLSINKNDNIIVAHRSHSLSKFSSISIEWNNYTKLYNEKKLYINLILKKNPSYIVLLDDTSAFPILTGYNRRLMSKFNGNEATRNPFNLGHKYTAYLFKLSKYN